MITRAIRNTIPLFAPHERETDIATTRLASSVRRSPSRLTTGPTIVA